MSKIIEMRAWETGDVPDKVFAVVYFIWCQKQYGRGPTWAEIAQVGGWYDRPRSQWRAKMRYMRRFGVMWMPNREKSTRIAKEVIPHMLRLADERLGSSKAVV